MAARKLVAERVKAAWLIQFEISLKVWRAVLSNFELIYDVSAIRDGGKGRAECFGRVVGGEEPAT